MMCPEYSAGLMENIDVAFTYVNGFVKTRSILPWSVKIDRRPAMRKSMAR